MDVFDPQWLADHAAAGDAEPGAALASALDELAAGLFGGARGAARIAPALAAWTDVVGEIAVDDADADALRLVRIDACLCDLPPAPSATIGDTWAWRAATARVVGLSATASAALAPWARRCIASIADLFEVWPGPPVVLRGLTSGVVAVLGDPLQPWPAGAPSPVALWQARAAIDRRGCAWLARPPLEHPLEARAWLGSRGVARIDPLVLVRQRLRWTRARRGDPHTFYGPAAFAR